MNLCLDIGNSKTRAAIFDNDRLREDTVFWHGGNNPSPDIHDRFGRWAKKYDIEKVGAVSVAPKFSRPVIKAAEKIFGNKPLLITAKDFSQNSIGYRAPERLGGDRLINAYAAFKLYGGPALVVDIGTAITCDLVDAGGKFLGGAIAPGPGTMARSLPDNTAGLPLVRLKGKPLPLGRDTGECIESGIYWGTVGMIRELTAAIQRGRKGRLGLVFTGGLGRMFAAEFRGSILDELLTLKGVDLFLRSRARTAANPGSENSMNRTPKIAKDKEPVVIRKL